MRRLCRNHDRNDKASVHWHARDLPSIPIQHLLFSRLYKIQGNPRVCPVILSMAVIKASSQRIVTWSWHDIVDFKQERRATKQEWDNLAGSFVKREIRWRKAQSDLTELFDEESDTMIKAQEAAKGVEFKLVNERALVLEGPEQKVDHLISFLQQLIVKEGQSAVNYIIVRVVGADTQSKLDDLQQKVGNARKVVPVPALHFSVAHTKGTWSAEQVRSMANICNQTPPTTTTNTFVRMR
ncbi:predicted protein [Lichtheimia corymbifera JMRC:FSU:9682]|uniref:Uncharacterized protein n=1 Tax=Lichtheimia corymbifera JMRC:FSU:9682 TaxID=1263082 RepID=A0A068SFY1_9FUNG|nr:predicted protein [Lichtheimia corymbifera JMRC:FSU:9682]